MRTIDSGQNALIKDMRKAFRSGEPTGDGYCAIESVKTIEEAIRSGLRLRAVVFSKSGQNRAERLLPQVSSHAETAVVSDEIFESLAATESPQGVAALVRIPKHELDDVVRTDNPLLAVAAGLQDPGNFGTLVRSAEAFGAAAALATEGTVSAWNAKSIRASAGSLFRLPMVKMASAELVAKLRERGIRLLATSSHKGTPLPEADLRGAVAVFVGNEGAGIPKSLAQEMDETVVIPQASQVESLNAGVAASIVLYEAARQRRTEVE
ncbi:MAG: TrmH family RNA methyltransferase [Terriglobales bacterium]